MYLDIDIEIKRERDGRLFVFLSHNGSSGFHTEFRTKKELKEIINDYTNEIIDEEVDLDNLDNF